MRRSDWRAGALNAIARGLQRAASLLDHLAYNVEHLAVRVRAVDAGPDRSLDPASSQPAEKTAGRSGQPPAQWLEQVRRGSPPEHWLRALRQAQVQTIDTQRAAETAEAVSSTSPTKPVSSEAHDHHAHLSDGFQPAQAARFVTPQSPSEDRAASAVTHAGRQASRVFPKSIEPSAPINRQSDRVEKPKRVTPFRLLPLAAVKNESRPAPVEGAEETKVTAQPHSPAPSPKIETLRVISGEEPGVRRLEQLQTKTQSLASEELPLRTRPELELNRVSRDDGIGMPSLRHKIRRSGTLRAMPDLTPNPKEPRRETTEKHVAGVTPAKRSTRGWPQPGEPPALAVDEQFVTPTPPVRQASPAIAPAHETVDPPLSIKARAPINVSAPNVPVTQAAKVVERWAPREVITPAAGPVKDTWAELPDEQSLALDETPLDEDWDAHMRTRQHLQQLDLEQRGILWNESPF